MKIADSMRSAAKAFDNSADCKLLHEYAEKIDAIEIALERAHSVLKCDHTKGKTTAFVALALATLKGE
jgi:hypothetical protein